MTEQYRIEELVVALRDVANRAGAPTAGGHLEVEIEEQRASLDWIAARAAEALKGTP